MSCCHQQDEWAMRGPYWAVEYKCLGFEPRSSVFQFRALSARHGKSRANCGHATHFQSHSARRGLSYILGLCLLLPVPSSLPLRPCYGRSDQLAPLAWYPPLHVGSDQRSITGFPPTTPEWFPPPLQTKARGPSSLVLPCHPGSDLLAVTSPPAIAPTLH